ncbi:MAG TPA: hypothetical protein ENF47_04195 [Thermoprotei archaeon]|nr:hypothetical protein [Thermoprotei archaeon]
MSITLTKYLDKIRVWRRAFISVSLDQLVNIFGITTITVIAIIVRMLPIKYGGYITEFDPYLQYYSMNVIIKSVENQGISGLFSFFTHHISLTWQPEGVDLGVRYYPGVPYTGAMIYLLLKSVGLTVTPLQVALYLPVMFGVLSVLVLYLIGKNLFNSFVGLTAALFYSVAPSVIARSNLGWFDTDGIGVLYFLLSIYFIIISLNSESVYKKTVYSILSGLFGGMLAITWGAFPYIYLLYALLTIAIVILQYNIKYYELSYFPGLLIMTLMASSIPRTKLSYIIGIPAIIQYFAISLLIISRVVDLKQLVSSKLRLVSSSLFVSSLGILLLSIAPQIGLTHRHLSVALPVLKSKFLFVTTVQEQAGTSFIHYFRDLNIMLPFSIFGFYVIIKNYSKKAVYIAFLIILITTLYAAASFVRLLIIATPFLLIAAGIGVYEVLSIGFSKVYSKSKSISKESSILKNMFLVFLLSFIIISSTLVYVMGIRSSDMPATILSGASPYRSNDWLQALEWIKANVGDDEIVAAWWDYGYWISFVAGKKTLADNGTLNQTRINLLAEMFMSNEEHALRILKKLNASYILIFLGVREHKQGAFTYYTFEHFGEDGKFVQIARIAGVEPETLINVNETNQPFYKEAFWNTFLGRLIPYQFIQKVQGVDVYMYSPKYPTSYQEGAKLILVFRSTDPAPGEVLIYKIVDN